MASGLGTRCRFSGRLSRISRMRCTTAVCEVMEAGGVLRARERACKTITSPGAASRKRHAPFLDPSERFAQGGSQVSVCPAGMLLCEPAQARSLHDQLGFGFHVVCLLSGGWFSSSVAQEFLAEKTLALKEEGKPTRRSEESAGKVKKNA